MGEALYETQKKIGKGAYGEVYRARNRQTNIPVALKVIKLSSEENGIPVTAIREISLLRELQHENIISLFDVFHSEGSLTLVFECMDGDLNDYLRAKGGLDAQTIRSFMFQLLSGVAHCHERQIWHRDLKPQNLLLRSISNPEPSIQLKLADFGLARSCGISVRKLTPDVVTLWYRAPDVLGGSEHYTCSLDLWSCGAILAEMVTGKVFLRGADVPEQLRLIFSMLGRPTLETWRSIGSAPNQKVLELAIGAADPAMLIDFNTVFGRKIGPAGVDLLRRLLCYEPSARPTANEALCHPFITDRVARPVGMQEETE